MPARVARALCVWCQRTIAINFYYFGDRQAAVPGYQASTAAATNTVPNANHGPGIMVCIQVMSGVVVVVKSVGR